METPTTIQSMLSRGESRHLAFKQADVDLEALGATICALLNSGGGQILVGATDDGAVEGNVEVGKVQEMLRPIAGGDDAVSLITPNAIWDLTQEQIGGRSLVVLDVPAGADLPYVFRDSIFVRVGSQTRKATGTQVRELVDKRYLQEARWERQPALEVSLADLDEREITKTVKVAAEGRGWQFRKPDDIRVVLEDLNLLDHGRLTNAAVVLFAKEAGHILPQSHVRLTAYPSDKGGVEISDDRVLQGHLFSHLEDYEAFIGRHVSVSSDLTAAKPHREDRPRYPYWSLREGFRNALMHRDYGSIHGRVSVSAYQTRFEIWSAGDLPRGLSIGSLKTSDRSLPVNPDIAQVVFLRGLAELLGRGTRKMVGECTSQGLPEPMWRRQAGGVALTLRARAAPGEVPKELNARQIELLRRMKPGDHTGLNSYRDEIKGDWSVRTLRGDLSQLARLGYLVKQGRGRSTFYIRTEKPAG